ASYAFDQSQRDLDTVLDAYWNMEGIIKYMNGYGMYRDKAIFAKLSPNQQSAVLNEIVCEADDVTHAKLKRKCEKKPKKCKDDLRRLNIKVSCVANATSAAEKCFCDPQSIPLYCEMLQEKNEISKNVKAVSKNHQPFKFPGLLENITANRIDLNYFIWYTVNVENITSFELFCDLTVEVHRLLSGLKKKDVFYCLLDDQFKRNVIATQPYSFCDK
ncbi:hypothetical protein PENTCL1PPCAC_12399, partial [Pristionchus entomophagus]